MFQRLHKGVRFPEKLRWIVAIRLNWRSQGTDHNDDEEEDGDTISESQRIQVAWYGNNRLLVTGVAPTWCEHITRKSEIAT